MRSNHFTSCFQYKNFFVFIQQTDRLLCCHTDNERHLNYVLSCKQLFVQLKTLCNVFKWTYSQSCND